MRLSTRARYAVRAMIDLASHSGNGTVTRDEIAERQQISALYLSHILLRLGKAGLVVSSKGPGGGYTLTKPAAETSVGEILRGVGEPMKLVPCVGRGLCAAATRVPAPCVPAPCVAAPCVAALAACDRLDGCAAHLLWERLTDAVNNTLESTTLADLCGTPAPIAAPAQQPARLTPES